MNDNTFKWIFVFFMVSALSMGLYMILKEGPIIQMNPKIPTGYDSFQGQNFSAIAVYRPGLYVPYTEDNAQKMDLMCHESCHLLVYSNYSHFCYK